MSGFHGCATGPAGPPGPPGVDGADGEDSFVPGPPGTDGTAGTTGADGGAGPPGFDGADGEDSFVPGPPGTDGTAGTTGADGGAGPPGFDGADGEDSFVPGPPGTAGPAGVATLVLTTVEVNIAPTSARDAGTFTIAGAGLTTGKPVLIQQASGPYTGKGDRTDEAEMDEVTVTGKVISAVAIECFWTAFPSVMIGNVKFDYVIGG